MLRCVGIRREEDQGMDGVNCAVHERLLTIDQARPSARDRSEWKRIISN